MGRAPCCDKMGVKKGPWTPEEDFVLVSYIQEHGSGNWRAVPTNTGLKRCSKSCRLRWTNYLRPGIKRGNFTPREEKLIIDLQALLGNRWAAIASYLPERTDNDIKNYWNTHLKKQLNKLQTDDGFDDNITAKGGFSSYQSMSKGQWERRLQTDIHTAKQALCDALSVDEPNYLPEKPSPTTYVSNTENISRLLENWMRNSPKFSLCSASNTTPSASVASEGTASTSDNAATMILPDVSTPEGSGTSVSGESNANSEAEMPFSILETWLFDESIGEGNESLLNMSVDDHSLMF